MQCKPRKVGDSANKEPFDGDIGGYHQDILGYDMRGKSLLYFFGGSDSQPGDTSTLVYFGHDA